MEYARVTSSVAVSEGTYAADGHSVNVTDDTFFCHRSEAPVARHDREQWCACCAIAISVFSFAYGLAGCQDGTDSQVEGTSSIDGSTVGSTGTTTTETSGDPTSSATEGSETASTTGTAPECGNGIREFGEQCDGDAVAGIPCPNTCNFPPMTVLWEIQFDVDAASRDSVLALAGTPDGRVVAGGEADSEAWIAVISPTGELEWIEQP